MKRKMLSTNNRTSWPSSSRKYSATVRPESATRRRAPGGSFICPYTSVALSITPDSLISRYRSFPSRVRSPTPANTEKPPWWVAMLWMSSMMTTVLPTPAPPNSPTLPPLEYGSSRSTTLMPVSSTSVLVSCSSNAGAGRWIGSLFVDLTGPLPSTGSPSTLISRPSVSRPTGMEIGAPVSLASMLRTNPSVPDIATVRTRFSPRCCATSSVR